MQRAEAIYHRLSNKNEKGLPCGKPKTSKKPVSSEVFKEKTFLTLHQERISHMANFDVFDIKTNPL